MTKSIQSSQEEEKYHAQSTPLHHYRYSDMAPPSHHEHVRHGGGERSPPPIPIGHDFIEYDEPLATTPVGGEEEVERRSFSTASVIDINHNFYRSSDLYSTTNKDQERGDTRRKDQVFVRGSLLDRNIEVNHSALNRRKREKPSDYKGRIKTWPGILLLFLILGTAGTLVTHYAIKEHQNQQERSNIFEKNHFEAQKIKGSTNSTNDGIEDLISDDGVIGNPKKYPPSECEFPDYQSKNGRIVAISANGTEVPLSIKGVNWFGMEGGNAIPFGLWDNSENGTTAYQIGLFLSENKFNAVRFPLSAQSILQNTIPNGLLINKQENRALSVKDYLSLIKSIIKVLQFRRIGIVLSIHTLTPIENGALWYNPDVPEDRFLEAIDILTENLCDKEYWNLIGIDLKNEPYKATWGDESAKDFRKGAKKIGNRMLKGCPNWLGFVEGVTAYHNTTIGEETFEYQDWYGGGLQGVKEYPLDFEIPNKLVWAPHYYTPSVYPQGYFYGGGKRGEGDILEGYIELEDDALRERIRGTMNDMFGYLASTTGPAIVMGEFGGIYATDAHPKQTNKRVTDFTLEIIKEPSWAGGFLWSLNPESRYQYNPADEGGPNGQFEEGLLTVDWLSANDVYMQGLTAMDTMKDLQKFPCFSLK
jgi:endoglucanase